MARLFGWGAQGLMCGIAGLTLADDSPPPDPAVLETLAAALVHRGPDGWGGRVVGHTALVQTRLAINDPRGADQPFVDGALSLVANGEIYNHPEIRASLTTEKFVGANDCAVGLPVFRAGPEKFPARFRGMYAMAVHDQVTGTLTLTRDPFGIKPLYTVAIAGGLAFASEPQALLAAGLAARAIDPVARDALLQLQFYPGAASIFPGITRVLPGETLRVANGRVVTRSREPALAAGGPDVIDEAAALARLDAALRESVDMHLRGDAPAGLFLSGGIDSACLLACMAQASEKPVLAFTAGFDVPGAADERAPAESVARSVGAQHVAIEISASEMFKNLPAIVSAMDDPAADYAIIPSWFLARRARQDVKVVLSGEGGDEMFAGYGRYRDAIRPWYRGGKPMRRQGIFDRLEVLRGKSTGWRDGFVADAARATVPGRSPLQIAQATDVEGWLPADLLVKLDRCLMAHGVEGRTPFLDPVVMQAGFCLPDQLKLGTGGRKYLLRQWLKNSLPAAQSAAPKQGFTVPIGAWIAAEGTRLGPLVAAQPGVAEIAAPDRVRALFRHATGKREGVAAWTLLFYALWHQAHILARPSDGSVFEVLGEAA